LLSEQAGLAARGNIRGNSKQGSAVDLTADQKAALAGLLREAIACDRFPLSPRVRELKAILAKLDPPAPAAEPYPPTKAWVNSSIGRRKRRR
jgi:hypothetical protein